MLRVHVEVKQAVVKWLVGCFEANDSRAKMSYRFRTGLEDAVLASDGFFLNLNWVLLRLCRPFLLSDAGKGLAQLSSVDHTYCSSWSREQCSAGDDVGPLVDFSQETKLSPHTTGDDDDGPLVRRKPNFRFVTHCFFLTHKSLILGEH